MNVPIPVALLPRYLLWPPPTSEHELLEIMGLPDAGEKDTGV